MQSNIETQAIIGKGVGVCIKELEFDFLEKFFLDIYSSKVEIDKLKTYIISDNKVIFKAILTNDIIVKIIENIDGKIVEGHMEYIKKSTPILGVIDIKTDEDNIYIEKSDKVEVVFKGLVDEVQEFYNEQKVFNEFEQGTQTYKYSIVKNIVCARIAINILRDVNLDVNIK